MIAFLFTSPLLNSNVQQRCVSRVCVGLFERFDSRSCRSAVFGWTTSEPLSDSLRHLKSERRCAWFCIGGYISDAFRRELYEKSSLVVKIHGGEHRLDYGFRCCFDPIAQRRPPLSQILDQDVSDERNAYTALYRVKNRYSSFPTSGC